MKLLALIVILCFPGFLPDGGATLTKDEFISMEDDPSIFPSTVHIYYCEALSTDLSYDTLSLIIYGDGTVIMTKGKSCGIITDLEFYALNDIGIIETMSGSMVELDLFESNSEGKYNLDAIGIEVQSYYMSIRAGDDYYTINFADYKGEEPSWYPLIESMRSVMNEYMIEEYSIDGTEYLEILDTHIEIYGKHSLFTGDYVRRYIEENIVNE